MSGNDRKLLSLLILLVLLLAPAVTAQKKGSMKLLAVTETPAGIKGSAAELHLEIKPGEGRVFMESSPASKIDTQISTRFAKEIACKYLENNCDRYDFFYTIEAESSIIGGPSAGAAVTILTISLLNDISLNQSVAITGTINSGELIGPVGYLKEKINAARQAGVKKVLVPIEREIIAEGNTTINLTDYGRKRGLEIVSVGTIDEALKEFTGKPPSKQRREITIHTSYTETMRHLAESLCQRSSELQQRVEETPNWNSSIWMEAVNATQDGWKFYNGERYYSAASYCFGSNVKYSLLLLEQRNLSKEDIRQLQEKTQETINEQNRKTNTKEIQTITDLETFMVVKDRLIEANDFLNLSKEALEKDEEDALQNLAFSIERINSAISWNKFFDTKGKKFALEEKNLKRSCIDKIAEAEEHYQYLQLFFPNLLPNVRQDIERAYIDLARGNYALCLSKATIAKAQVNTVLSSIGVDQENIGSLLARKLAAAEKSIAEQTERDIFPILGYSYYEYANSLKDDNPISALLYAEYALELSNLDMYFPEYSFSLDIPVEEWANILIFVIGISIGFVIAKSVYERQRKKGKRRR
ncbi:hypothetical protein HYS48_05300 [Candidatus Woesearchaeota archaeon]|nr:hypothetical protein [Candidatus Woesearchaeota archaeon]